MYDLEKLAWKKKLTRFKMFLIGLEINLCKPEDGNKDFGNSIIQLYTLSYKMLFLKVF